MMSRHDPVRRDFSDPLSIFAHCARSEERGACYGNVMALTLEDLDRRVSALERAQGDTTESLRWVVAKLGRIQAVQDEHTLRLDRLETKMDGMAARLDGVESRLDSVERKLDGLIEALPGIVADAVRSAR